MVENILGWYSLVVLGISLCTTLFSKKDSYYRFTSFILVMPIIIYIYIIMFGAIK